MRRPGVVAHSTPLALCACAALLTLPLILGTSIAVVGGCEGCSRSYQALVEAERDRDIYYQKYLAAYNFFQYCLDQGCDTGMPAADTPTTTTTTDTADPTTDTTGEFMWAPNDGACDTWLGEDCAKSPNDCGCLGEMCDPAHEYSDESGCVVKRAIGTLVHSDGIESYRSPASGDVVLEGVGRIHFPDPPDRIAVLHDGQGVARIEPRGTELCIYVSSGSIMLQVLKGAASFSDFAYRSSVVVEENHSSIMMLADPEPSEPLPFEPADVERWWEQDIGEVGSSEGERVNRPPTASFVVVPDRPTPDDTLSCTNTSFDPDGDSLTYSWYFDGEYDSNIGNLPDWTWPNPPAGEYTIALVIVDGRGGSDECSMVVTVAGDGEAAESRSGSNGGILYLLSIPVLAVIAVLIRRRRKGR